MPFIAKNPLSLPEIDNTPSTPPGTRGIIAKKDGLYEVDASGNEAKLGGVQSDFEQNDETQLDYIKNRTHYVKRNSIIDTSMFEDEGDGMGRIKFTTVPELNKPYKYNIDGVVGEVVFPTYEGDFLIGSLTGYFYEDSSESDDYTVLYFIATYKKISIDIYEEIIVPLPEKYIPDSIARKSDLTNVATPDWSQNDETAPDYIKNRTHYEIPAKNYGYAEFDLESTSMDVSDGTQTVSLTDPLELGVAYPYNTDKGSGTFTVDFNYQYADGRVVLGDTGYEGDYFNNDGGSYINFGIDYDREGYIQIGTPAPVKQLAEKYIPDTIARVKDVVQKESGKGLSTNDFTTEHKEKLENIKPADWSQNDETQLDYIKNRTHYEIPKVALGEAHRTEEETTFENGFDGICDVYIDKSLVEVGKEYNYTINGQSGTFIFNNEYMRFGGTDGYVYDYGGDVYDWQTNWAYGSTVDVVLYEVGKVKPLDEKYIPDSIARKSDLITYESKVLMAEFINAQPWENKTLPEPIDLENEYIININGTDVKTEQVGTNVDFWFNYNGQPVFQGWCNESENTITIYPEYEGRNVSLYKISVKQLDDKYIPDSIARVADVEEILDELHAYAQNLIGGDA